VWEEKKGKKKGRGREKGSNGFEIDGPFFFPLLGFPSLLSPPLVLLAEFFAR
jgi:hypothetical protein